MHHTTQKAAIYCRYSTEHQDASSIVDQTRVCERFALETLALKQFEQYHDYAISGASRVNRPQYQRMLEDIQNGKISVIIAESTSRLTRDVEDGANLIKTASFHGVRIYCVNSGTSPLSSFDMNVNSLLSENERLNTAKNVHRGMYGLVVGGKSAGGRTYGYRSLPRMPKERGGNLEIDDYEADIVREIFNRYIQGESPRSIAAALNARNVPSPRALIDRNRHAPTGEWRDSTILGNRKRGTGILWNPIYQGVRRWNRNKMVKNPTNARRHSRPNSSSEWVEQSVPELAIVEQALWEAVQRRGEQQAKLQTTRRSQKPKRIFSGILRCGSCGSTVNSGGIDPKNGKTRIRCDGNASRGTCPAPIRAYANDIEALILNELTNHLMNEEWFDQYISTYQQAVEAALNSGTSHQDVSVEISAIERKRGKLLDLFLDNTISEELFRSKDCKLLSQLEQLNRIAGAQSTTMGIPEPCPYKREQWRNAAREIIESACEDGGSEPAQLVRALIDRITITPKNSSNTAHNTRNEVFVKIDGRLDALLRGPEKNLKDYGNLMVAEEGLEPPTRGL